MWCQWSIVLLLTAAVVDGTTSTTVGVTPPKPHIVFLFTVIH
eukprot:COSAG02_NODE_4615_length_5161_cov_10.381865_1_plen_42_part_00